MRKTEHRRLNGIAVAVLGLLAVGLGGGLAAAGAWKGELVAGQNADGRLELFKVGPDGELRHRSQEASHSDWSTWSSLGSGFMAGLAVANNADGTLELFAVDAGGLGLRCTRQIAPNSRDWGRWIDVGGGVMAPVAVAQNLDGRLEVFGVDAAKRTLKHVWQTDLRNGWSDWVDLPGTVHPGFAVSRNRDGRLELFAVDARRSGVIHCSQTAANRVDSWSPWRALGELEALPGLVAGQNADGALSVFAVDRAGTVRYAYQSFGPLGEEWSSWQSLGGNMEPGLVLGQHGDGRLEVFAISRQDGKLKHCYQNYAIGKVAPTNWSSWEALGSIIKPAAVARNPDGTLEVFAIDDTQGSELVHRRIVSNRDWLAWSDLEHPTIQYVSRTWHRADGLPHDDVQAIAQTQDGYLWVGTREGLARFDGVQFTRFDPHNTPELTSASVTALYVDRDGVLWIGTDLGLVRLDRGVFSRLSRREGLPDDAIRALYEGEGSFWIGTAGGLSRYREGKMTHYTRREGLPCDAVNSIGGSRDGHVWVATEAGLARWTEKGVDSFTVTNGLPNNVVRSICRDRRGRVWMGSNNGVIACTRGEFYSFYAYNVQHGLSDNFVSAICADRQGNLWAGTYSGLNRFREGRFLEEQTSEGLPYDRVNAIFEDRQGAIWVGTRDGLTELKPKRFRTYGKRQGLTHNNVSSVLEDKAGNIWIGSWNGGLNQLNGDRVTTHTAANGLARDQVLALCEGHDGSLWIGADGEGGLTRLINGRYTRYDRKNGLVGAPIRVLCEDQDRSLWIGTSQGLSRFQDGRFCSYRVTEGLADNGVRAVCEDAAGRLWIGTDKGLSCWENGHFVTWTITNGLASDSILALYADKEQNLWIGTAGGGLSRLRHGITIATYTTREGLYSDEVFEILEDDYRCLWMSCAHGVFKVRKTEFDAVDRREKRSVTSVVYGKADGMESTLCTAVAKPAGWKSRDGRLWFPTTKGLISVLPNAQRQPPPSVFIEQLLANRQAVPGVGPRDFDEKTPGGGRVSPVLVQPGRGELEFRYTALDFQSPEKCLFKYRLDGVDADWIEAGTRRVAHYNNIYPGRYDFRVVACDGDGVWNEIGATLGIQVLPRVWQTWWFRGLAALAALGSVGALARYTTQRRLQRKMALLQQQHAIEKERGRIAKDIHDDLGSSLTRIMMLGQRAQEQGTSPEELQAHALKIVTSAQAAVQALDEIVWAVDPENDTLDGLVGYLSQYATQFFETCRIRCRLEMPIRLSPVVLPAEVRHNLFLVIKEAFNNILRHAQATEVRVRVAEAADSIEIFVEDNGRGFKADDAAAARLGNGLKNMRRRMEELHGGFRFSSAPGLGTKLVFVVPSAMRRER